MRLDHKAFETKVERPLADLLDVILATCHMAWIHEERKFRIAAAQFDGHLPLRVISVLDLVKGRESSVDDSKFLDAGSVQTLKGTDPQIKVRVHRVLHKHRDVCILKSICNFLHKERIGRSSRTQPDKVNTILQALEHVLLTCHLSRDLQSVFLLCLLHPLQALSTYALKRARMCPRFPYSRSIDVDSNFPEMFCGLHNLLLRLGAARASHNARPWLCEHSPLIKRNEIKFFR